MDNLLQEPGAGLPLASLETFPHREKYNNRYRNIPNYKKKQKKHGIILNSEKTDLFDKMGLQTVDDI